MKPRLSNRLRIGEVSKGLLVGFFSLAAGMFAWNQMQSAGLRHDIRDYHPATADALPQALSQYYQYQRQLHPDQTWFEVSAESLVKDGFLDAKTGDSLVSMQLTFHMPVNASPEAAENPFEVLVDSNLDPDRRIVLLADGSVQYFSPERWNAYWQDRDLATR